MSGRKRRSPAVPARESWILEFECRMPLLSNWNLMNLSLEMIGSRIEVWTSMVWSVVIGRILTRSGIAPPDVVAGAGSVII